MWPIEHIVTLKSDQTIWANAIPSIVAAAVSLLASVLVAFMANRNSKRILAETRQERLHALRKAQLERISSLVAAISAGLSGTRVMTDGDWILLRQEVARLTYELSPFAELARPLQEHADALTTVSTARIAEWHQNFRTLAKSFLNELHLRLEDQHGQ